MILASMLGEGVNPFAWRTFLIRQGKGRDKRRNDLILIYQRQYPMIPVKEAKNEDNIIKAKKLTKACIFNNIKNSIYIYIRYVHIPSFWYM